MPLSAICWRWSARSAWPSSSSCRSCPDHTAGGFPRSLPIINWFVLIALLGGPRFLYRIAKDRRADRKAANGDGRRVPVLLAGDGDGAEQFIRAMRGRDAGYRPVAILSVKGGRVGRQIHDVEVMGTLDQLPEIAKTLAAPRPSARTRDPDRRTYGRRRGPPAARRRGCRRHDAGAVAGAERTQDRRG